MKDLLYRIYFSFIFISILNIGIIEAQENSAELLDIAHWRVIYLVDMQARKEGQPHTVTDTMALDIGQTWSVFYNLFREERVQASERRRINELPGSFRSLGLQFEGELRARLRFGDEVVDTRCHREYGESAKIYKNRLRNEVLTIDEAPPINPMIEALFRFAEHIPPQDWTIIGDTLTVLGYLCYKATTSFRGRSYIAWFTPDIPINEGPFKFYGLPGLILKIKSDDGVFRFQAIGLQEVQDVPIQIVLNRYLPDRDGGIRTINKQFIDGNLQQWQAHRKDRFSTIQLGFLDRVSEEAIELRRSIGSTNRQEHMITFFRTSNPIEFVEIEIIE